MTKCPVAIIGAGPYGLSIAAYLRARGIDFRIFGNAMSTWLTQMPKGMRLKSEGFASSLYDPASDFTLGEYCREQGLPYADLGLPVPINTFTSYGMEFQKKYVSDLENKLVTTLTRSSEGFEITLDNRETFTASKVVMAVGLTHFGYLPPDLSRLPGEVLSHSSAHSDLGRFTGRKVIVIGSGASALDLAALLHQSGAEVQLAARSKVVRFHDKAVFPRPLLQRVRRPLTGIGNGWKLMFYTHAPGIFQRMSEKYRLNVVKTTLGPAPGWFVKDEVVGKVPFHLGVKIARAQERNSQIHLELDNGDGTRKTLVADHCIAATGYKVDLTRLRFFDTQTRDAICCVEHSPVLSSNFESSVQGIHFVGASSANSFGPLMRFAFGAKFTAKQLTRYLAESLKKHSMMSNPVKSQAASVMS
jgi:cation diffusion facilitator CzcD-associated flavoprotein CzcO